MIRDGNQVYNNGWKWAVPYVWDGSAWKRATPYIYNGSWLVLNGVGLIVYNFLENTGLTYNSKANIMVREDEVYDRWLDKDSKVIKCTDNKLTRKPTLYMKIIPREWHYFNLTDSAGKILKGSDNKELMIGR